MNEETEIRRVAEAMTRNIEARDELSRFNIIKNELLRGIKMSKLINNILEWGRTRELHNTTDLKPQLTKLIEELGEIAAGVARNDDARIIDGVGDLLVVLINFGAVHLRSANEYVEIKDSDYLEYCLNHAWEEIKHRTGKTENGVFIKEEKDNQPPYTPTMYAMRSVEGEFGVYTDGPFPDKETALALYGDEGSVIMEISEGKEKLVAAWDAVSNWWLQTDTNRG